MIELRGIKKSFGSNLVLNSIDLDVEPGEVVSLIGPSGTGKTTLLRTINFLDPADKGTISIDDLTLDYENATESEIINLRRKTAMVFQNYSLFKNKTILENVTEGLIIVQNKSQSEAEAIAKEEIDKVGLGDKLNDYPYQLSGGQQQRIGIARALALKPRVLLLDEPTSSLDPERSAEILKILQNVALSSSDMSMLITTHEMNFAKHVSNKVVFMEKGEIVEQGTPDQLFNHAQQERTRNFIQELENPLYIQ
ncbi:amino acid ABC transporter ATP-binding protein [Aerococcaceae bacterium DSM 111022]|nr:amino acid ABC transporter ATP-binding protein [Aerococcaceae bacterium DSM 111022]